MDSLQFFFFFLLKFAPLHLLCSLLLFLQKSCSSLGHFILW